MSHHDPLDSSWNSCDKEFRLMAGGWGGGKSTPSPAGSTSAFQQAIRRIRDMTTQDSLQWTMCVHIWHARDYGHKLQLVTYRGLSGHPTHKGLGTWKGLGVPEEVLNEARSLVVATLDEYLITRYGIQGELPVKWGGEPDPF